MKLELPKNNRDRIFIDNAWERKLHSLDIPRLFWTDRFEQLGFYKTTFEGMAFTPAQQRNWIKYLVKNVERKGALVVLSSEPTDTGALIAGFHLLKSWFEQQMPVAVLNTATDSKRFERYPSMILIHNVLDNATPERIQTARDLCLRFKHALKLVVVAGAKNPERWAVSNLRLHPTIVFKLKDLKIEQPIV